MRTGSCQEQRPPRRILLALAEPAERRTLAERLAACGFQPVDLAPPATLPDAIAGCDALLLDAGPDVPELCARLRRAGAAQPILVLHDNQEGLVERCLDAGANDGMARPVRALELAARLRAQLRHTLPAATPARIGPYLFRPDERVLQEPRSGRVIRLTATEAAMLRYLLRAEGAPVPRPVLLHEVWGYRDGVTTHTVETHIYRLRRKIEPEPGRRRLLLSEEAGYRLNLGWEPVPQGRPPDLRVSA